MKMHTGASEKKESSEVMMAKVLDAVRDVRHGSVSLHIQDGIIVQIDKVSKIRLR